MSLFSYMDETVWLLKRYHISILIHGHQTREERDAAVNLREAIVNKGGNASVVRRPEVRWNSINVIVEPLRVLPAWRWYFVKIYSAMLLVDAIATHKFDRDDIEKYAIKYEPPPVLNIHNISKLF